MFVKLKIFYYLFIDFYLLFSYCGCKKQYSFYDNILNIDLFNLFLKLYEIDIISLNT